MGWDGGNFLWGKRDFTHANLFFFTPPFFLSVLVRPSVCMSVLSTSFPKTSHRIDNVAGEEYQIDFCHAVCLEKMPDVDKSRSDRRP